MRVVTGHSAGSRNQFYNSYPVTLVAGFSRLRRSGFVCEFEHAKEVAVKLHRPHASASRVAGSYHDHRNDLPHGLARPHCVG